MKRLVRKVLCSLMCECANGTLHAVVASLLATAVFMLCTAADLGPMAPLVIALAFYVAFAAVAIEAALLIRYVVREGAALLLSKLG